MCKNNRAKQELQKIKLIDTQIDSMLAEVSQIRSMATKVTASIGGEGGGGSYGGDKLGDAIARIIDLEQEIDRKIDDLLDRKKKWLELIYDIGDPSYIKVLHRRYFLYETFERIATEIDYSYRNVCYIHGKALQALNEMIDKED